MNSPILDASGQPFRLTEQTANVALLRQRLRQYKQQMMRAKYDAAQTISENELHWSNADTFSPHLSASPTVRQKLRSRSRYEMLENNPYLKGTALTIAGDFVGRGPKLQIRDKRISPERRQQISLRFHEWFKLRKLRQKLWRMRLAKMVDGESFMRAYRNRRKPHPVQLDFQVIECDRVTSEEVSPRTANSQIGQIDGVRFDKYENPTEYFVLLDHPGGGTFFRFNELFEGNWVKEKFIVHWFRQDRGWLRGIPETVTSLPLCAILRRYTLAMVRHAETSADLTAVIETEGPPQMNAWTDDQGNVIEDDPFDTFPIDRGMIANLPWGYKLKQFDAVPLGAQYDHFVGSILREITRPLLVPFNVAGGTSKDSNMASAVVDQDIYTTGQQQERTHCEEEVLDKVLSLWWSEAVLVPGYLGDEFVDPAFRLEPPMHTWRWDKVGLDHTDPSKVANALKTLQDMKAITDRDIQETYYNRDVEEWREEVKEDEEFRMQLPMAQQEQERLDQEMEQRNQERQQSSSSDDE